MMHDEQKQITIVHLSFRIYSGDLMKYAMSYTADVHTCTHLEPRKLLTWLTLLKPYCLNRSSYNGKDDFDAI